MANQVFTGLTSPNDVLEAMRDFLLANGWTILNNCTPDLAITGSGLYDGELLAVTRGSLFILLRSEMMSNKIFPAQAGSFGKCIGATACTAYTMNPPSGNWYDQPNVLSNSGGDVLGVGFPAAWNDMVLYCNQITDPEISVVFTLRESPTSDFFYHIAFAMVQKVGTWNGGTIISGTRPLENLATTNANDDANDRYANVLYGMNNIPSTFIRIDVDSAPLRANPVIWAAAGPQVVTGKILGSMIMNVNYIGSCPKYPHYGYLQSQTQNDYGRNVNTLNCISVNLPLALFIQRDPDALMNFSQIGYVPGVFACSLRNVAPGSMYEISYPKSGNLHQVFPHSRRIGYYGYDGISIAQEAAT